MYRILRLVHLVSGAALIAFLLMYFVTGYVLIKGKWFGDPKPVVVTRTLDLTPGTLPAGAATAEIGARLQAFVGARGKPAPPRQLKNGAWAFNFFHPGHETVLNLSSDARRLAITERTHAWQRTFVGLHRLHGYGGGWLYNLWSFLMDLSSLSMIVFASTGVWMWLQLTRRRWPGYLLLVFGCAYTLGMVVYLLT
jgi:hypothetical protein